MTSVIAESEVCVPHLVAALAGVSPEAAAATMGDARLSYAELNWASDRLSGQLISQGAGPEVPVGICLERSFDYIIAALAIWKAGGAYLPLDPSWPESRRAFVLDDAQAPLLITGGGTLGGPKVINLDRDRDKIAHSSPTTEFHIRPDSLAYIIYTSGSTGRPKGVEVTHRNLLHLISWHRQAFEITAADVGTHLAGLGFDAAIWEIWPYLSAGARVAIADETKRASPEFLRDWLVSENATVSFVPTAMAEQIVQFSWPTGTKLRYLLTGADTLHRFPPAGLPFKLVNNYGPTECTVVATSGIVDSASEVAGKRPSIGKPITNTQIYLLNEDLEPVPDGDVGEIFIGGPSVARGYRNQPKLTAERFLADRFSTAAGARVYRTGDLAALLPDGQIAFHGRVDHQIKILGHRIEPAEIVSLLTRNPKIASAAVAASGPPTNPQLTAYVVPAEGESPQSSELVEFLAHELPEYMIPSAFVRMTALPLTSNGKIDLRELPAPTPENVLSTTSFRAPGSQIQVQLAAILCHLLALERVGLDDNFFLLGGTSLLGAQLIVRVRARFGVQLTLRDLFLTRTLEKLAERIERELLTNLGKMSDEQASRILSEQKRG